MGAIRNLGLMYARNLRQFPRIPTVLVFGLAMPVIQLVLFGNLFAFQADTPQFEQEYPDVNYQSYIVPAVLLFTIFVGMANSSAALIVDLRTGYFDKLRTTPARPWQVFTGRMLAEMTRVSLQGALVLLLAIAIPPHANVESGLPGAVLMIALATVFSACVSGLGVMALAMKTKSDQATQSAFPLFFVAMFLSSAFVTTSLVKNEVLSNIIKYNPVDYLIRSLRELMIGKCSETVPGPVPDTTVCVGTMVESYPWDNIAVVLGAGAVAAVLFGFLCYRVYKSSVAGK
jgi:ABC-2 type transport system permease protein